MTTQWHPLFAHLLRPLVESHYQVETKMTVGDAPREADLVLLRRTAGVAPFQGLWRRLTIWNLLEFKGPTVSARVADLDLLVELGLGIDRRLNEERHKKKEAEVDRGEVSFWYMANHLGRRFRRDAGALLGPLSEDGPGVWRATVLGHPVLLVSNREVPVERDSIPVHLLVREPLETTRKVAEQVADQRDLWQLYAGWIVSMFPALAEEMRKMAKKAELGPIIDMRPIIKKLGMAEVIGQLDVKEVIDAVGVEKVVDAVGVQKMVDTVGVKKVVDTVGVDALAKSLSPSQRRALLKRLQAKEDS